MENHDKQLWTIAKRRSLFKKRLLIYFFVNSFLCAIWFITIGKDGGKFWPVWSILGWGFGLAIQYVYAYRDVHFVSTEKEYEKLKNKYHS